MTCSAGYRDAEREREDEADVDFDLAREIRPFFLGGERCVEELEEFCETMVEDVKVEVEVELEVEDDRE
ncbi:hypothetical protein BGZ67_002239 [Mortierella alpina]|nr:hypothetical protein BGZ67_002239 [Mortierella alpina]